MRFKITGGSRLDRVEALRQLLGCTLLEAHSKERSSGWLRPTQPLTITTHTQTEAAFKVRLLFERVHLSIFPMLNHVCDVDACVWVLFGAGAGTMRDLQTSFEQGDDICAALSPKHTADLLDAGFYVIPRLSGKTLDVFLTWENKHIKSGGVVRALRDRGLIRASNRSRGWARTKKGHALARYKKDGTYKPRAAPWGDPVPETGF